MVPAFNAPILIWHLGPSKLLLKPSWGWSRIILPPGRFDSAPGWTSVGGIVGLDILPLLTLCGIFIAQMKFKKKCLKCTMTFAGELFWGSLNNWPHMSTCSAFEGLLNETLFSNEVLNYHIINTSDRLLNPLLNVPFQLQFAFKHPLHYGVHIFDKAETKANKKCHMSSLDVPGISSLSGHLLWNLCATTMYKPSGDLRHCLASNAMQFLFNKSEL